MPAVLAVGKGVELEVEVHCHVHLLRSRADDVRTGGAGPSTRQKEKKRLHDGDVKENINAAQVG